MAAPPTSSATRPAALRRAFFGTDRLRAGWRVALFLAVMTLVGSAERFAVGAAHVRLPDDWTPLSLGLGEAFTLSAVLVATAVLARLDRRSFRHFGIAWREAFGARFWEGSAWGLATVALLVGAIAALGGYEVRGLAYHGPALVRMTAGWLVAMALIGLAEETWFRGYPLAALTEGIGFWPAAILTSVVFGCIHYFLKPMENLADGLSVGLLGLFLCLTLRRTGNLWFAIGFHAAFDFAALALFGAPNTGNGGKPVPTRLLDSTFHGPDWLTGGVRGVEASGLVFAAIALLFVLFHLRFRANRFPMADGGV